MENENEQYDIFTDLYKYNTLESMRRNLSAGLGDEYYCHNLGRNFGNYAPKIVKTCKQFLQMCSTYNFMLIMNAVNKEKSCAVMNYWLNSDLREIINERNLESIFYTSMTEQSKKKVNTANCNFTLYKIEDNEFNKLKILYGLYENFYKINSNIKSVDGEVCKQVCIYKNECAIIYNNNVEKCPTNNKSKFCHELENFKKKYMAENTCNICPEVPNLKPNPQKIQPEVKTDQETQNLDTRVNHHTYECADSYSTTDQYSIIPVFSCIFVGIFIILFLFYKFTKFGNCLRANLISKRMIWNNIDEETNSTFILSPDTENTCSENTAYHIAYHSV
ncbi:PIR protein [Plasmodium ovale]|uniref:PIR protein n=1 Tax=Plasmodium ovale TaxID=36330 RepID=A0A1C3KI77_PLAOA|nr:PIR protein [Plasmodium ovale]